MKNFFKYKKKEQKRGNGSLPGFDPVNSQNLYDRRNELSVSAKNFLYTPSGFILKGPIIIIFVFLFSAFIYSFIATVETKVNSTVVVRGKEYVIQSPVVGTVNSVMTEESEEINSQQEVITLLSDTELATRENIGEIEENMEKQKQKFKEVNFAINKVMELVNYYSNKNDKFSIDPQVEKITVPEELNRKSNELLIDSAWKKSDYYNIVQKTSVDLTEIWAGYQRTSTLLKKQEQIYNEDKELFEDDVITEYQIAESHQKYLNLIAQTENYINSFKIEIYNLLQEFRNKKNNIVDNYLNLKNRLRESKMLEEEIVIKDKLVVLKSKYTGVVIDVLVDNYQYINKGMNLMRIIRDDLPKTGVTYVTDQNIGNVKIGQRVFIKFTAYPYQEYGIQKGRITDIAADAKMMEGFGLVYKAEVTFEQINQRINLKYGMQGSSEIATGEKRAIELVFEPMTKVFDYIRGINGTD